VLVPIVKRGCEYIHSVDDVNSRAVVNVVDQYRARVKLRSYNEGNVLQYLFFVHVGLSVPRADSALECDCSECLHFYQAVQLRSVSARICYHLGERLEATSIELVAAPLFLLRQSTTTKNARIPRMKVQDSDVAILMFKSVKTRYSFATRYILGD
jgi:hypothetical protein